jgi:hypothetical protein
MGILDKIMQQYSESSMNTNFSEKSYDVKNYFSTYLPDGVKEGSRRIRVLPPIAGGDTPFQEMWGHKYKVGKDWKTFPCLAKEEKTPCPFCETREILRAEGTEQAKESAKKFNARKFYIIRVIDREKESEGVKFWRIQESYDKSGTFDKIVSAFRVMERDLSDPTMGMDLVLTIARNSKGFPIVQNVTPMGQSVLSDNTELMTKWLADNRTWKDVYAIKPYEYLEIVVKGGEPTYDKKLNRWVDRVELSDQETTTDNSSSDDLDNELTMSSTKKNLVVGTQPTAVTSEGDEDDDDLPF